MNSSDILDKLISIYFRKCYHGMGETTQEEEEFISQTFIVKVTDETKSAGYPSANVLDHLELDKEYILMDMSVSQSSSSLRLASMPNRNFNTVNFEYRLGNPAVQSAMKGLRLELDQLCNDRARCKGDIAKKIIMEAIDERQERLEQFKLCL